MQRGKEETAMLADLSGPRDESFHVSCMLLGAGYDSPRELMVEVAEERERE